MTSSIDDQFKDLNQLLELVTTPADRCEAWFYLSEMEAMLSSTRKQGTDTGCYDENINLGTFIDCWKPKCYETAYEYWAVNLDRTKDAQKAGATALQMAQARAQQLSEAADEARSNRRQSIVTALKAAACCDQKAQ